QTLQANHQRRVAHWPGPGAETVGVQTVPHQSATVGSAARLQLRQHRRTAGPRGGGGLSVILVDADLLLYAEDSLSEQHPIARDWWDEQLSGAAPVCLCWPVLKAFIRIGTNPRLHQRPLTLKEACERVQSWFEQP